MGRGEGFEEVEGDGDVGNGKIVSNSLCHASIHWFFCVCVCTYTDDLVMFLQSVSPASTRLIHHGLRLGLQSLKELLEMQRWMGCKCRRRLLRRIIRMEKSWRIRRL